MGAGSAFVEKNCFKLLSDREFRAKMLFESIPWALNRPMYDPEWLREQALRSHSNRSVDGITIPPAGKGANSCPVSRERSDAGGDINTPSISIRI